MNPRLKALLDHKQRLIEEGRSLDAKAEWSDADKARAGEIPGEMAAAEQAIEEAKSFSDGLKKADAALNGAGFSRAATTAIVGDIVSENAVKQYRGRVRSFTGAKDEATRKAYRFGMWLMATAGNQSARNYCSQTGMLLSFEKFKVDIAGSGFSAALGQSEGVNEDGGYLVPPEFEDDLILLREQYGIFRQYARPSPMSSDVKNRPRRKAGLTAYFPGEGAAAATSKIAWDNVELVAKKAMVLAYTSTELNDDAVISMGDALADEIAYAFAHLEDQCGFIGDGTSTYGKIVGATTRLLDVYGAGGGVGLRLSGAAVGGSTDWSGLTLADHNVVLGMLPQFADRPDTAWYCHKRYYHGVMERLMLAAGGVTAAEVAQGRRTLIFCGYPVHISQTFPNTETTTQIPVVFGNLFLAADFGDRRKTTIMFSEHAAFTTDEIAARGTERFDIKVHDVGDTVNPGPLVGLVTAAA